MNEQFLLIVESLEKYKDLLESKNDEVCDGMTDGEKRTYQLGITNMYEINEEESGEYDLEDFVKWDSKSRE